MSHKIAIIVDSSPSMPEIFLSTYPMHVVPNLVLWEGKEYKDWEEITQETFFGHMDVEGAWPSTAAPPPAAFKPVYEKLLAQDYEILVVFPPTTITMGADAARVAMEEFPQNKIRVVETKKLGMVNGWAAVLAARAAEEGASLEECAALVEKYTQQGEYIGTLNTIDYLRKGGRIGGAAHFVGSVLDLKPILEMKNSRVEGVMRVRTRRKAVKKAFDYFLQSVPAGKKVYLAGMHSQADEEMAEMMSWARQELDIVEEVVVPIPPSNCVHYGPGAVGFAYVWVDN